MPSTLKTDLKKLESLTKQFTTVVNPATSQSIAEAKNAKKRRKTSTKTKKSTATKKRRHAKKSSK